MYQSENVADLASALAKAQGEFIPAIKDAANPYFKSKYANLCSINKACQTPLSKNGLSISQSTIKDDHGNWILMTKLLHASGQWLSSETPIITAKADIQSFGSACTYARRYGLSAIVGVVTDEDDDGESAVDRSQPSPAQKKYEQKKQEKVVNVKPVYITDDQGKELAKLLSQTDNEYQDGVWKHLTDQFKITCYDEMPVDLYEKVKAKVTKKIQEIASE